MRTLCVILFAACVTGCASPPSPEGSALSDGSIVYTLTCKDAWQDCYASARKICGDAGFEEIDRVQDGSVTSAGHLQRMHSTEGGADREVYAENPRNEAFIRVLTIRCTKD